MTENTPIKHLRIFDVFGSITFRCSVCMILYAAAVMLIFSYAGMAADKKLAEAFPSMETFLEHEEFLAHDNFDDIAQKLPSNCDAVIFDETGEKLFSTDFPEADSFTASDLSVIASSTEGRFFYEVLELVENEKKLYAIVLCERDDNSNSKLVRQSCICDSDGHVIAGSLFDKGEQLSARELSLLKGVYDTGRTIQKHEYFNDRDEKRVLVTLSPIVTESAYESISVQAASIWFAAFPVVLILTATAVLVLAFITRRMTLPLDKAINAIKNGASSAEDVGELPMELQPTYDNFLGLMAKLDCEKQAKQRIVTDISHDLKTPLTVIRGYSQAFVENKVPAGKEQMYMQAMNERARAAADLLEDLLAYAKTEEPSFKPKFAVCDVYENLRQSLSKWQPDIEQAGNMLLADVPDGSLELVLDWTLMERTLDNLLSNACVHNPPGITIYVTAAVHRNTLSIRICDTGKGIPPELKDNVFQPFVIGDDARSSGGGNGLGLAIASSFVSMNGGRIHFLYPPKPPYATEAVIEFKLTS